MHGSKFKAVNTRDRNFTPAKVKKHQEQIEQSIQRYLAALDTADRTASPAEFAAKAKDLRAKLKTMREQMRRMQQIVLIETEPSIAARGHIACRFDYQRSHTASVGNSPPAFALERQPCDRQRSFDQAPVKMPCPFAYDGVTLP